MAGRGEFNAEIAEALRSEGRRGEKGEEAALAAGRHKNQRYIGECGKGKGPLFEKSGPFAHSTATNRCATEDGYLDVAEGESWPAAFCSVSVGEGLPLG